MTIRSGDNDDGMDKLEMYSNYILHRMLDLIDLLFEYGKHRGTMEPGPNGRVKQVLNGKSRKSLRKFLPEAPVSFIQYLMMILNGIMYKHKIT